MSDVLPQGFDIEQFAKDLRQYYLEEKAKGNHIIMEYIAYSLQNAASIEEFEALLSEEKNQYGKSVLNQIIAAKKSDDPGVNRFLKEATMLTWLFNKHTTETQLMFLFDALRHGLIKDELTSYWYLRVILGKDISPNFSQLIRAELAFHPCATLSDICLYAESIRELGKGKTPDEIHDAQLNIFQRAITMLREKIKAAKIDQDADELERLITEDVWDLINYINKEIHFCQSPKYTADFSSLKDIIKDEFNLQNIFEFENDSYLEQFKKELEVTVVEQTGQIANLESDVESLRAQLEENNRTIAEKDRQMTEMTTHHKLEMKTQQKLHQETVDALKKENASLETQKTALRSAVVFALDELEERAKGNIINVRTDMQNQLAALRKQLEENNNTIKI